MVSVASKTREAANAAAADTSTRRIIQPAQAPVPAQTISQPTSALTPTPQTISSAHDHVSPQMTAAHAAMTTFEPAPPPTAIDFPVAVASPVHVHHPVRLSATPPRPAHSPVRAPKPASNGHGQGISSLTKGQAPAPTGVDIPLEVKASAAPPMPDRVPGPLIFPGASRGNSELVGGHRESGTRAAPKVYGKGTVKKSGTKKLGAVKLATKGANHLPPAPYPPSLSFSVGRGLTSSYRPAGTNGRGRGSAQKIPSTIQTPATPATPVLLDAERKVEKEVASGTATENAPKCETKSVESAPLTEAAPLQMPEEMKQIPESPPTVDTPPTTVAVEVDEVGEMGVGVHISQELQAWGGGGNGVEEIVEPYRDSLQRRGEVVEEEPHWQTEGESEEKGNGVEVTVEEAEGSWGLPHASEKGNGVEVKTEELEVLSGLPHTPESVPSERSEVGSGAVAVGEEERREDTVREEVGGGSLKEVGERAEAVVESREEEGERRGIGLVSDGGAEEEKPFAMLLPDEAPHEAEQMQVDVEREEEVVVVDRIEDEGEEDRFWDKVDSLAIADSLSEGQGEGEGEGAAVVDYFPEQQEEAAAVPSHDPPLQSEMESAVWPLKEDFSPQPAQWDSSTFPAEEDDAATFFDRTGSGGPLSPAQQPLPPLPCPILPTLEVDNEATPTPPEDLQVNGDEDPASFFQTADEYVLPSPLPITTESPGVGREWSEEGGGSSMRV